MNDNAIEAIEEEEPEAVQELATVPENEPMTSDGMDAVIAVASKMDAYAKAMDTITNAIIKRSYPGDWVCHARTTDKPEDRKANIGSAAAERIAAFLGIQERSWSPGVKDWSEDHKHYTWRFEADFGFGKRWVHAAGRASSQDKFFGYAHGAWKPLDEIKEDDVRMAAFRACRKEGVRALLGLRAIPIMKLKELGYDINQVRYANFEEKSKTFTADEKKATEQEAGIHVKSIQPVRMVPTSGKTAKGQAWMRWDIWDKEGVKYALFANDSSKRVQKLQDCVEQKVPTLIKFAVQTYNNQDQYMITTVEGVEENGK